MGNREPKILGLCHAITGRSSVLHNKLPTAHKVWRGRRWQNSILQPQVTKLEALNFILYRESLTRMNAATEEGTPSHLAPAMKLSNVHQRLQ